MSFRGDPQVGPGGTHWRRIGSTKRSTSSKPPRARTEEDHNVIPIHGETGSGTEQFEITVRGVNKQPSIFKLEEQKLWARHSEFVVTATSRPIVAPGELWSDADYGKDVALGEMKDWVMKWKRPKDFLRDPCLYSDGVGHSDITMNPDVADWYWFLHVVKCLADQPEYLKHIIPEGSYRIGRAEYDGIFHCRFWQFGNWVDVYVDDHVPVLANRLCTASSNKDDNELWITLLEKAFSKYHGSYQSLEDGLPHQVFATLTGGTSEIIELTDIKPVDLYSRIKKRLSSGSILSTTSSDDMDACYRFYVISAVCKFFYKSEYVSLVRVYHPFGSEEDWTEAWCEWGELSAEAKAAIERCNADDEDDDGGFWMSFEVFYQHFESVTLCNYGPTVEQDGHTDDLDKCWVISGEWYGDNAAGPVDKMANPKFEFVIPQEGTTKEGTPVVIEFIQPSVCEETKDHLLSMKADLFRVESVTGEVGSQQCVLHELTSEKNYYSGESRTYRYPALTPGTYLVVPYYYDMPFIEREFLLRIYSQVKLLCREVKELSSHFVIDGDNEETERPPEVMTLQVNQQPSIFKVEEHKLWARHSESVVTATRRPTVAPGELWTDPEYDEDVALEGTKAEVDWVRPQDVISRPCLYTNGVCSYDIFTQREVTDTCWFWHVVESLKKQPEYLKHIIPSGSYSIGTAEYDGIFHCRFWQFGNWVNIYVDDYIPVSDDEPYTLMSCNDDNEMWVTLLEKAYSKYHGSYKSARGHSAQQAFTTLTGGISEVIKLENTKPQDLYKMIKSSLAHGSILAADVITDGPMDKNTTCYHSYIISSVCKVFYRSEYVSLIRLLNPGGGHEEEWRGAWSDGSLQWTELSRDDRRAIDRHSHNGSEDIRMSFEDFYKSFKNVTLCNYTPIVEKDGHFGNMDKCWVISGEWYGDSAAGPVNKMVNPKFEFVIPQEGTPGEGTPVVIELRQRPTHKESGGSLLPLKADLFRVESVTGGAGSHQCVLHELTSEKNYYSGESRTYRYPALTPGTYMVIPLHNDDTCTEREFLLRIFSQVTLKCSEVKDSSQYIFKGSNNADI